MNIPEARPVTPGIHTYAGSCHCGAVRFEVDLDLLASTMQCNCTRCTKTGWWGVIVRPDSFRLLSDPAHLAPEATNVRFPRHRCTRCGLCPYGEGHLDALGGDFVGINVRCLDGVDLSGVQVRYLDGLHNTWAELNRAPWQDPFAAA